MALSAITAPISNDNAWALTPSFSFVRFPASTDLNGTHVIGVLPEGGDIEAIYLTNTTASSGAGTITFYVAASGTALASGTAISAAEDLTTVTANTSKKVALINNTGFAAGSRIGFVAASASTHVVEFAVQFCHRKGGYQNVYDTDGTTVLRKNYPYNNTQVL